jgi:hypothetical protein
MKVRVNGRTGWVARSTVESAEAREDMPRNTRRRPFVDGRSTRRGWGSEAPDDRVGADAIAEDDDEEDAQRPAPRKKVKAKAKKKAKRRAVEVDDEEEDDEDSDSDSDDEEEAVADCDEDECEEEEAPPEPKVRTVEVAVAKTKLRSKPSKKGKSVHKVKKGVSLVVLDEKKGWMLVEDPDGEQGWIKKTEIFEAGNRPARQIDLTARVGFERMAQVFRSDGNGALAGYDVAAASAQISVRADYVQKYQKSYLIGADLRYDLGKSTPGIRYATETAAADIPYTTHDVQAAALIGYDFHHKTGAAAFGRLGYHYGLFQVSNVGDFTKNLAHLPSETLAGVTLGVAAEAPRLSDKVGAHLVVDYMVMGKRAQTVGLEDGSVSTANAAWGAASVDYQWKPDMSIDIGYQYEYSKTVWTGAVPASMRGTNATEAARKDTSHALLIGLVKTW